MSVKKILSTILALAMVLTMASFPAFAEDAAIAPVGVTSPFTAKSGYSLNGIIDGSEVTNSNYFRASVNITSTGTKGDDANLNFTVDFGLPYNVTSLYTAFGSKFATGVAVWGSNDNATWTELADLTLSAQRSTSAISHEGYYRYVKVEAYATKDSDPAVLEATFYGHMDPDVAEVTGITADDIAISGGSLYTNSTITPDKASLVDGDVSNTTVNTFTFSWSSTAKTIEITLPEAVNLSNLALFWGNTKGADNAWNVRPAKTYDVYVAGEDGVYGETPVYSHDDTTLTDTPRGTNRTDFVTFDTPVEGVKKVKVAVSNYYAAGCLAIRELDIYKTTKEIVKIPATYTVNYVDAEGNPVATPKTVSGKFVGNKVTEEAVLVEGYKPTETTKTITLVDGTNEINFVYEVKGTANYTVNYVDGAGQPIADAKVVMGYEGDTVTEVAPVIDGYVINELTLNKSIVIDLNGTNEITFTYKKVVKPASISAKYAAGVSNSGGHATDWAKLTDGKFNAIMQYAPTGSTYVEGTSPVEITYAFSAITDFTKLTTVANSNRATAVKIYTSLDGIEWTEVVENTAVRDDEVSTTLTREDGVTGTVYVNEYDLTGASGTYLKFEILESTLAWCGIYEMSVEGTAKTPLALTADNVTVGGGYWGWDNAGNITGDASVLFNGAPASNTEGYFSAGYFSSTNINDGYAIVIDLGGVYNDTMLAIQGGAADWNYAHMLAYDVYVAGVDGKYGEDPVASIDNGTSITGTNKVRTDALALNADGVRYVKIVPTYAQRRVALGEIMVYGVASDDIADMAGTLGGQVRLPVGSITAGLRFGATVLKSAVGIEGDNYEYDETAALTFGMFMLPADKLEAHATLADYLVANDYAGNAVKVPAEKIKSQDAYSVTYTAVLVNIPESAYTRDIIAVPYICNNGAYTLFEGATRNYADVCAGVATAYEAGDVELTAEQIALLESVLGRTLTAPEAPEEAE